MDEGLVGEGLLSRFTVIEYKGKRVYDNENKITDPSPYLLSKLGDLITYVTRLEANNQICDVAMTDEALAVQRKYSRDITDSINTSSEVTVEMWNRANLMALRLSALYAISENYIRPVVTVEAFEWAKTIVNNSIGNFQRQLDEGNVGAIASDTRQMNDTKRKIKEYYLKPYASYAKKYGCRKDLYDEKILPYSFLHNTLTKLSSFRNDNVKATDALNKTIAALISNGDIKQLHAEDFTKFNFTGKGYVLVNTKILE